MSYLEGGGLEENAAMLWRLLESNWEQTGPAKYTPSTRLYAIMHLHVVEENLITIQLRSMGMPI